MAPSSQGPSQQSPSRRPSEVPNGLPSLNPHPHEHIGPIIYQTPDTFTTPVIPGGPNSSPELAISNATTQAYCEQLQEAFNDIDHIIRHRIRSTLNDQHSDYWNRHWIRHYAQRFALADIEKLELREKNGHLTTKNNAMKEERGQLHQKRTWYRKTVFRLASSVARQQRRSHNVKLEAIRLRARIRDLELREADTNIQHAKELQTKQMAIDKAEDEFQIQIDDLKQAILDTNKSSTEKIRLKQESLDEQIQLRSSLEASLQEKSDRMFDAKRDLVLSNKANVKLQKEIQEATLARDRAMKNEEAERLLSMERVNTLQADVDSGNAVVEYLKQRSARFADRVDKNKAVAGHLRSEVERVKGDCAAVQTHATRLTHRLAEVEAESKSLLENGVKLQDRLKKSTKEIDELSNDVRTKGMENLHLQNESSQLLKANRKLQRKIDRGRRGLDDDHSDDEYCQSKDKENASHLNDSGRISNDTKASYTPASNSKTTVLHEELTPPKTPHLTQVPTVPAPTPSPMTPPLTNCYQTWLPPPVSQKQPSQSATSSSSARSSAKPAKDAEAAALERSDATKDASHRVLSREELAAVGRIQKIPGTETKAPTGPKSNVPQIRQCSWDTELPNKCRKADLYRL